MVAKQMIEKVTTSDMYAEAIKSDHSKGWKDACDENIESVKFLKVDKVMDTVPGRKHIDTKWVFKMKEKEVVKIERFKARRVLKGYLQTYGVD